MYISKGYWFSWSRSRCTKRALRCREKFDNICVGFIRFTFPSSVAKWPWFLMIYCMFLLGLALRFWIFYKLEALGAFMSFFEFCSVDGGWLSVLLCKTIWYNRWVTTIMDKIMFNDCLIGKWKWILRVVKAYFIHDVVEAFITLTWKA